MGKRLEAGTWYSGRRPDGQVFNTTLDSDAVEILRQFCPPGRKSTGKFLARLLYEHAARADERQRLATAETQVEV